MALRICMVVQQDYLIDGRVRRYAESLADRGVKVDILCVRNAKKGNEDSYRDDIRIYRIPLNHGSNSRGGFLVEYFLAVMLFSIWLLGLSIRNRYDLIHIHNVPDFLVFCGLVPRLFGAKLVLDVHDPMPEFYLSKFALSKENLPVKLLKLQERLSARFAHAVITANDNFKQNLTARGIPAAKLTVVHNIPDANIFHRRLQTWRPSAKDNDSADRPFTLLCPSTIAPRYGLDLPIRAAVQLRRAIPNLRVQIVGPHTRYADELKQLARDLAVERHVQILPSVPVQTVADFMAHADVGIYTAYPDPHMNIATPTKVLEYMQMGLPVVAARLPVVEQIGDEDSIRFFTPGSVDDFAAKVLELWRSPELRQSLVDGADQGFVRHHTWLHEQAKYFSLVNELLGTAIVAPTPAQDHMLETDMRADHRFEMSGNQAKFTARA